MGPYEARPRSGVAPLGSAGGSRDWVAEMNALLVRHKNKNVTWLRPDVDHVQQHTASWDHVGRAETEGKTVTESRPTLAELVQVLWVVLDG